MFLARRMLSLSSRSAVAGGNWQPNVFEIAASRHDLFGYCHPHRHEQRRFFAKKKKKKRRSKKSVASTKAASLPLLSLTLKKFNLLVHPDHFNSYPDQQDKNMESLALLNGVLSDLEEQDTKDDEVPLTFFVKTSGDSAKSGAHPFEQIDFSVKTVGGSSRKMLEAQLGDLFSRCGLPSKFEWDEKYVVTPLWKRDEGRQTEDEKRAEANKAKKDLDELLEQLNPALQAIAAVPHLEKTHRVRQHVENNIFKELAESGFRIKHIVVRIWSGERNVDALTSRLDAEHKAVITRIVDHAKDLDAQLGR